MTSIPPSPPETVESRVGPAIREALERTMEQIGGTRPRIGEDLAPPAGEGISAVIDYNGDTRFALVLSLPKDVVAPLTKTFTGVPIGWEADVLHDVVGELLNVLAGGVAAALSTRDVEVKMSLPRVERTLDADVLAHGGSIAADFGVIVDHGSYRVAALRLPDVP